MIMKKRSKDRARWSFVSDGAKCDCGNIVDLFDIDNKVAITDPVYPVYLDTNIMSGRTGKYDEETGKYEGVIYIPCTAENNLHQNFQKKFQIWYIYVSQTIQQEQLYQKKN